VGKRLGGDIGRTAEPSQPKRYSIPYDICSAIESSRKEERRGQ